MNLLTLAGNLGADPEVRFTSSGQKVTTLRMAVHNRRGGKDETLWWRVTIWGEHLDKMISYLKKGSSVIVVGEMSKPEIFNDKEGRPQVSLNMTASNVMFSPFGRGSDSAAPAAATQAPAMAAAASIEGPAYGLAGGDVTFRDDDIPF